MTRFFESGQMDQLWCISMTNNVKSCKKKSMEGLKRPTSVFLQGDFGDFRSSLLKTAIY